MGIRMRVTCTMHEWENLKKRMNGNFQIIIDKLQYSCVNLFLNTIIKKINLQLVVVLNNHVLFYFNLFIGI